MELSLHLQLHLHDLHRDQFTFIFTQQVDAASSIRSLTPASKIHEYPEFGGARYSETELRAQESTAIAKKPQHKSLLLPKSYISYVNNRDF
jgi:hypothetical protein